MTARAAWRELTGAALLAIVTGALPAAAQSTSSNPADATPVDEVVVSLRRPTLLKDVAGSVTVFDSGDIADAGVKDLRDIADRTPNFAMLDNYRPGLERFQVRGIITPQIGDPPLAFVIDGVTAPDPEFATQQLFDVARVEVLRGAQGALYGLSAVGGVVNIVTQAPTDTLQGWVDGAYETGNTWRGSAVLSGPIVPGAVYFRVGGYRNDSDGLIDNVFLHTGADFVHDYGVSALLRADLGPRTVVDVHGQFGEARDGIGYYDAVEPTTASIEDFHLPVSENVLGVNLRNTALLTARVEHRFDAATLTLAGGFFQTRDSGIADADLTALPTDAATGFAPNWQYALDKLKGWTFEGRLASDGAGPFTWALGSLYQDRRKISTFSVYDDPSGVVPLTQDVIHTAPLEQAIIDHQTGRTWALSAEGSLKVTRALQVTVAGRYDEDYRQSVDPRDEVGTYASATFGRFQPKVSLSYRLTGEVNLFAGYSRGFRSGGFNQYSPVVPREYAAETTDSYELGAKAAAFADRLTLTASLFRNDQSNAQITEFNPETFTLENVAIDAVRSQGAELEMAWRPLDGLRLEYAGGYTDSEIRAYKADPVVVGATMPYVPDFTWTFSIDYERPLADAVTAWTHIDWRMTGPRSFTLDFPDLKSRTHVFVDMRVGLRRAHWDLTVFGANLFDERQPEDLFGVFNGAVDLARQPNHPRRFGVEVRYRL